MTKVKRAMTKAQLRNLNQFKDLTDAEFEIKYEKYQANALPIEEFENRIKRKIEEFGEDYDLSDLKSNDMLSLRALAQAYIALEDLEVQDYKLKNEGLSYDNIQLIEKIGKLRSDLRSDISKLQDDLKITRKVRDSDKEQSVQVAIQNLTEKAKVFYKEKMFYIFCPECKNLLMTAWFHYPDEERNKLWLVCGRESCGHKFAVYTSKLGDTRGVNVEDTPDFFK